MLKAPEGLRCKEQTKPHNTVKHRESADSVGQITQANLALVPRRNINDAVPRYSVVLMRANNHSV